jgi:hypothetical protein
MIGRSGHAIGSAMKPLSPDQVRNFANVHPEDRLEPLGTGVTSRNHGLEAAAKLAEEAADWHAGLPDARPKAASDALAALARRIRARKEPETIATAEEVYFTAIGPSSPFGHLCIGPVSWSQIAQITKIDQIQSDSFMFGDRDRYAIAVFYEDGASATWNFERDKELRDKIFALIVAHQCLDLKSYG